MYAKKQLIRKISSKWSTYPCVWLSRAFNECASNRWSFNCFINEIVSTRVQVDAKIKTSWNRYWAIKETFLKKDFRWFILDALNDWTCHEPIYRFVFRTRLFLSFNWKEYNCINSTKEPFNFFSPTSKGSVTLLLKWSWPRIIIYYNLRVSMINNEEN